MGPEGIILANPPITTFQQSLTHSALIYLSAIGLYRYNSPVSGRVICEELEVEQIIFDTIQRILRISDLSKFFKDNVDGLLKVHKNCYHDQ